MKQASALLHVSVHGRLLHVWLYSLQGTNICAFILASAMTAVQENVPSVSVTAASLPINSN